MKSSFKLIHELTNFLQPLDAKWWVSGGWAIDIHLSQITRERCDLDISVPFSDRVETIRFFLEKNWRIEGKLLSGFKTHREISDYNDDIHYFWSFQKGADFIREYLDEGGNRRIAYNRDTQSELDYIEVFFDRMEDEHFIYRSEPRVKRHMDKAILEKDGVRYLAPELVLLFKSNYLSEKNFLDFDAVSSSLDGDAVDWLIDALLFVYNKSHSWLEQLNR